MAEELGGAFLSAFLQAILDRLGSAEFTDFIKGRKLSTLLNKVETTMISFNGLIDDAEELQITKPAVKLWLYKLKNVVYDADDLLDEIAYESLRSELEPRKHKVRKIFSSLNPFGERIDEKLEEILWRLELLVNQKDVLGLKEGVGEKPFSRKVPTSSVVDESGIYGRDQDKEAIMKLLLSDDPNGNNVGVISIVGMGGLGKTTLAQLLYNDSRVKQQFRVRAWIYVSGKYDVLDIFEDILTEVTGMNCESMTPNQIEVQLHEELKQKKFLLVLDDIWEENYTNWNRLSTPLISGARGSKIIVTTRNESVASVMGTTPSNHLKELSDEDCWSLFAKHAFIDGNSAAHPRLEVIGQEIVRKCGGLPLPAKTLGGLLRSKRDAHEWKKISKSSFWDLPNSNILPALKLSYHYLPSQLKRCFAYCAILPKGYSFTKEELVCFWMAEGFLVQSEGNKEMQDVGDVYFQDLVSRSFFQHSGADKPSFIMHDLMHDLAEFVSREFCFRLEGNVSCCISENTRHLSHIRTIEDIVMCPDFKLEGTFKGQLLRTFLLIKPDKFSSLDNKALKDLLLSLERVRVLSLSGHGNLEEVPDSIGSLKHLRHLNLSGASIRRLPESLNSLYNLQTLNLFRCENLTELPTKMGRLINLCSLDTRETKLRKMPPEMGNLTKLRVLTHFIIGKESQTGIEELGKLKHLQGELSVQNLQNVVHAEDAKGAIVREQLKKLEFKWTGEAENLKHVHKVLKMLRPHRNLECLRIIGYGATRFPSWVGDSSFSNFVSLKLNECKNCLQLPPLGQLPFLKDLSVAAFDKLTCVGPEFYGICMSKPFGSLESLLLERIPHLHVWKDEPGAFPLLRELFIRQCPSLKKTLPNHLPSLRILEIEGCPQLAPTFPRASVTFQMTVIDNCREMTLKRSPFGFRTLIVDKFHSAESLLETLKQSEGLCPSLEYIEIKDSRSLKCFPLESFPKLKRLGITGCPYLESLTAIERTPVDQSGSSLTSGECSNLPLIQELYIIDCPQLLVFAALPWAPTVNIMMFYDRSRHFMLSKLPSGFNCLEIFRFLSTEEIQLQHLRGIFSTLEEIKVKDNSSLKCFPVELFPHLERFYISGCPNLQSYSAPKTTPGDLFSLSSLEIKKKKHPSMISIPSVLEAPSSVIVDQVSATNDVCMSNSTNFLIIKCQVRLRRLPSGLHYLGVSYPRGETVGVLASSLEEMNIRIAFTCFKIELFPNVKKIIIGDCQIFESLDGYSTSLRYLRISDCQNIISFPGGLRAPNLTELQLWRCLNLESLTNCMNSYLPSLKVLYVCASPKFLSFPEDGLPSRLEVLCLRDLKNLVSLGHQVFEHLTILR